MKTLKALGLFVAGALSSLVVVGVVFADIAPSFVDVNENAYYAEAVNHFAYRGIVDGYDTDHFGPNDPVTRGQLMAILERYDDHILDIYRGGKAADLVNVVCNGFSESDFSETGIKDIYNEMCALP